MSQIRRVLIAIVAIFAIGFVISTINGQDAWLSLTNSLQFAVLAGALLLFLLAGAEIAERKGYDRWLGVLVLLLLNLGGLIILWLLPDRSASKDEPG